MAKIKVFVLDSEDNYCRTTKSINSKDTLSEMYNALHCDCVDAKEFEVDGEIYTIWFDDEFLLKNNQPVATFAIRYTDNVYTPICGSYMITKVNAEGETVGLSAKDIKALWRYTDYMPFTIKKCIQNHWFY